MHLHRFYLWMEIQLLRGLLRVLTLLSGPVISSPLPTSSTSRTPTQGPAEEHRPVILIQGTPSSSWVSVTTNPHPRPSYLMPLTSHSSEAHTPTSDRAKHRREQHTQTVPQLRPVAKAGLDLRPTGPHHMVIGAVPRRRHTLGHVSQLKWVRPSKPQSRPARPVSDNRPRVGRRPSDTDV